MRLKTSYFNGTVLKKDITRFAPLWGLYIVGLLMALAIAGTGENSLWLPIRIADSVSMLPAVSMLYALLVGQLLMGDLWNTRMCNALHALPMKREGWLLTHTVSGILFSLVPNLIFVLAALPVMHQHREIVFWWLLIGQAEYLFFLGLSFLCAMLAGSRFSHLVIYGIANAAVPLLTALIGSVYEPLLYGVKISFDRLEYLCPVFAMSNLEPLQVVSRTMVTPPYELIVESAGAGSGMAGILGYAAAGVVLILFTALLYRRRKLERAGDFLAFRALNPVFLVICTLTVGLVFKLMHELFSGRQSLVFLAVGVTVGYFAGRMLLERQVGVFKTKNMIWFAVFAVLLGGSLAVTRWDPAGLVQRQPETADISCISYGTSRGNLFATDDPEQMAELMDIHRLAVEDGENRTDDQADRTLVIQYSLKNGKTITRQYSFRGDSLLNQRTDVLLSSYSYLFRKMPEDGDFTMITYYDYRYGVETSEISREKWDSLLQAVHADCDEGTMRQDRFEHGDILGDLELWFQNPEGNAAFVNLSVFGDNRNVSAWLEENIPGYGN